MVDREIGFSLWLDFVERDYLKNEFGTLIEKGIINGATSNPAIFASAITTSPAYRAQLESLEGKSPKEKYEALAIEDIKTAAKALRPLYDEDNDGYISIEVDPFLSNDTEGTIIAEGKRLFEAIGEPNVMIKVPATNAGYDAMTALLADGISVNATLIFSPTQAQRCVKAMEKGMEQTDAKVDGVVSVFVSRFDRMLDDELAQSGIDTGLTGIYNAAKIYNLIDPYTFCQYRCQGGGAAAILLYACAACATFGQHCTACYYRVMAVSQTYTATASNGRCGDQRLLYQTCRQRLCNG